ncbi:XdhC family protein [Aestuariicoccus sp. KMU-90]|uniref:XdhC family protein n=2 Tax=Thetidibacter halocola TaxID=2827239 RepID=A0A8J7WHL2_9RHOB|nr:XdhC family protein [Thetidibacter halocola]
MTDPATDPAFAAALAARQAKGTPFAIATVIRTLAATAAKPGAKALLAEDGTLIAGFLGGGCVRSAVARAAREAVENGQPQLVSIRPEDLLAEQGVAPGETRDGIRYARNGCPSRGSLDIFIEPVLPRPRLAICGGGPVALALAALAERFQFHRMLALPGPATGALPACETIIEGLDDPACLSGASYVVIATQGAGDLPALRAALASPARHIAFVASRAKAEAMHAKLRAEGVDEAALARVHAPAGLPINAITPDEIALSILADLVARRRGGQRAAP